MTTIKLNPIDNRKSFYNKAVAIEHDNGVKELKSYDTIVLKVDAEGKIKKLWNDYSATTMRHINAFLNYYGLEGGGKKWWDALEVATN